MPTLPRIVSFQRFRIWKRPLFASFVNEIAVADESTSVMAGRRACRTTVVDDQPRAVVAHGCRVGLHRAADLHRLPLNLLAHALVHRSALGDGRDERDRARRVARIRCRSQVDEARLLAHDATAGSDPWRSDCSGSTSPPSCSEHGTPSASCPTTEAHHPTCVCPNSSLFEFQLNCAKRSLEEAKPRSEVLVPPNLGSQGRRAREASAGFIIKIGSY